MDKLLIVNPASNETITLSNIYYSRPTTENSVFPYTISVFVVSDRKTINRYGTLNVVFNTDQSDYVMTIPSSQFLSVTPSNNFYTYQNSINLNAISFTSSSLLVPINSQCTCTVTLQKTGQQLLITISINNSSPTLARVFISTSLGII